MRDKICAELERCLRHNPSVRTIGTCQITGKQVEYEALVDGARIGPTYYHGSTSICITESAWFFVEARNDLSLKGYDRRDHQAGKQLVWSWIWQASNLQGRPLYLTTRDHLQTIGAKLPDSRYYRLIAFEDAIEEAQSLTFEQRAMNTLENLYSYLDLHKKMPKIEHWYVGSDDRPDFHFRKDAEDDGMAYGTTNFEAWTIYSYLHEEGLIRRGPRNDNNHELLLTPKAFALVSKLHAGRKSGVSKGFFVRKWDPELDEFYTPIMSHVASVTKCPVEPVWARAHNEKIDDKIMRLLRESTVVVVDVTGERFNVGLELGFAIGLRKPVILLRDRENCPKGEDGNPILDLPFDIRTYNCIFYDRAKPELVQEQLAERVLSAMADAKEGTI